jgi:hypothetical protein
MTDDDVGELARVKYIKIKARFVAVRVNVVREGDGSDQSIADAVAVIEQHLAGVDDAMDTLYKILEQRGCAFPDYDVD